MNAPSDAYSQLGVHHVSWVLKVLLGVAIIAGCLGAASGLWALYGQQQLQAQATRDRQATELASCIHGNDVRQALTTYLATFPEGDPTEQRVKDFDAFKLHVLPVDCNKAVITDPGSNSTPSTVP